MQAALLWRHSGLWVLTRIVHVVVSLVAINTPELSAANALWHPQPVVVLACMVLGFIEILRRGERLLIGNLGIGPGRLAGLLAAPPVVAEILVAIAGRV
jgi:hypothetical protein